MAVAKYDGIPVGGTTLTWIPLVAADFVAVGVYQDPNGLVNGALTIHADNGDITFDVAENAAVRDGLNEGAYWRLNLLTAASGLWTGDGNFGMIWRFTPQDNPGITSKPLVGFALIDDDGDATTSTAMVGAGMGWEDASLVGTSYTGLTTGGGAGTATYAGNSPDVLVQWTPIGPVGDDTTVGATDSRYGYMVVALRQDSSDRNAQWSQPSISTPPTDGTYGCIYLCQDGTGGGTYTMKIKCEYAFIPLWPAGEWT